MSERKASVVLELKNRIGGPMRRLRRQVARETAALRASFARVGRISRGMALGITGAATAVGALLTKMTLDVARGGDNIAKLADQLGIGTEALQEYRYAAERMGVGQDLLDKSLATFSKRLGEARSGTGALTTYLKKSNPALLDQLVTTENLEEAFGLYLKAVEATEDPTVRAAGAAAAFGRSGVEMIRIVRDGTENIDRLRKRGRDLGLVMSDDMTRSSETFMDALTNAKSVMIGVRNVIGGSLLPAFTQIMDSFSAYVLENRDAIKAWADEFASNLPERIEHLGRDLRELGRTARGFVEAVGGIKNVLIGLVGLTLAPLAASVLGVVAAVTQLSAALLTANKRMGALNALSAGGGRGAGRLGGMGTAGLLGIGAYGAYESYGQIRDEGPNRYFADKAQQKPGAWLGWRLAKGAYDSMFGSAGSDSAAGDDPQRARVPRSLPAAVSGDGVAQTEILADVLRKRLTDIVGGSIDIRVRSDGSARVERIEKRGSVDLDVDSGPLLLGH